MYENVFLYTFEEYNKYIIYLQVLNTTVYYFLYSNLPNGESGGKNAV